MPEHSEKKLYALCAVHLNIEGGPRPITKNRKEPFEDSIVDGFVNNVLVHYT